MRRISLSWAMMKQSYKVLMKDKELMLLPLVSLICMGVVLSIFFIPLGMFAKEIGRNGADWVFVVASLLGYFTCYTIGIFFQAALVAGACERMAGGDPTIASSLRAAGRRFTAILGWSLLAGTVGLILRAIEERLDFVGQIIMGIIGFTWTMASFFVIPVLVMERESIGTSFKRSNQIIEETWGEGVTGEIGYGLFVFLFLVLVFMLGGLLGSLHWIPGAIVFFLGIGTALTLFPALYGVYTASLYLYATEDAVPEGFEEDLFERAWSEH